MAVIKVSKNKNYTTISNFHLQDNELSLKAKGLLTLMFSLPDDWDYSVKGLERICLESKNTINNILKELEIHGYLVRRKIFNNGKISDWEYTIYENNQHPKNEDIENEDIQNEDVNKITKEEITKEQNNNLNEFKLYNSFSENNQCECISKSTGEKCLRRASFNINGKNYCNQHARNIIPDLDVKLDKSINNWEEKFESFWKTYPKKRDKSQAKKWFKKNKPSYELMKVILESLDKFKKTDDWKKDNGKYIPYPTTWLNGHRWEDEISVDEIEMTDEEMNEEIERQLREEGFYDNR